MNEEMMQQLMATAERLATAGGSIFGSRVRACRTQQEALNAKVDRIVLSRTKVNLKPHEVKQHNDCRNVWRNWRNRTMI